MSFDPWASIDRMAQALRRKEISSVELTRGYLDRLKTVGRDYRVVREITEEIALAQAKAADEALARGEVKSRLHGIPYGAKDLLATQGIPTRWGSPGHQDQSFDFDATVVRKLRDAGAVLIGKLAMIELAGGPGYNFPYASDVGATLCAWDRQRWAGGSSSGSGAAAALACAGFTIGSETSGSITCPSAFNGATGFRPTYGRVSRHGAMALSWTLDKIGPICRSAADCGEVLSVIAGPDPRDPSTLNQRLSLRHRGPRPRIGLLREAFALNRRPECQKSYEEALEVFRRLGYETVEVAYPRLPYGLAVGLIVAAEGVSAHEKFVRSERLGMLADPNQTADLAAALEIPATDYLWAMRLRSRALEANAIWEKCDGIFTPVFYGPAVRVDEPFEKSFVRMGGDGGPANLLGWPSMAFPIGFDEGAPLGGQVIAPAYREDVCLRVAGDFQRETDFHRRRPPISVDGEADEGQEARA